MHLNVMNISVIRFTVVKHSIILNDIYHYEKRILKSEYVYQY